MPGKIIRQGVEAGRLPFAGYAAAWIDERPGLRPKTIQLYRYLLRAHLQEDFGSRTRIKGASVEKSPSDRFSGS